MTIGKSVRRWSFVLILSIFLLFHQLDILLLRPITTQMIAVLHAREVWIEPVVTLSVGVSILFGLYWGYLFDRHSRIKILALISFLWGVTSWLVGISPTLATYIISSTAGGMDNFSASGVFSLIGDIFGSKHRGKVLSLLMISQPMALFLVVFISNALPTRLNWRSLLLVMGGFAFLFTVLINFLLHEPKRGAQEPGMTDVPISGIYLFDWEIAKENIKTPSVMLALIFSFLGTMPWFILISWISPLLQHLNQVSADAVAQRLLPALISVMIGYPAGGFLGDLYAKKRDTGRINIVILGLMLPSLFLFLAFMIQNLASPYFMLLLILMGFFMSFSWPNMISLIFEVTVPEVRSFATALMLALQALGGLLGPYLVSRAQLRFGLRVAMLSLSIGAWLLGLIVVCGLFFTLSRDIENLRRHMAYRSQLERRLGKQRYNPEDYPC